LAPSQRYQPRRLLQGVSWRFGRRVCLLKGCEQTFQAWHPFVRYCSSACREAARRWRQRTANRRYRASEQGKDRRRAQARRYRERVRERQCADSDPPSSDEGYPQAENSTDSCCRRPGCYEAFAKTARSPLQKFCSISCRQALRRVLLRERRWAQILGIDTTSIWQNHDSW